MPNLFLKFTENLAHLSTPDIKKATAKSGFYLLSVKTFDG